MDSILVFGSERFANFQAAEDRVDTLFFECMANESYKSLFSVVKLILILSHGQATVERGFSVNKEVEGGIIRTLVKNLTSFNESTSIPKRTSSSNSGLSLAIFMVSLIGIRFCQQHNQQKTGKFGHT